MTEMSDEAGQQGKFTWVQVYEAIATKLLDYRDNHGVLVDIAEQVLGERFDDMDPFTFFSMFNGKLQREDKRIEAIKIILARFDLNMPLPEDFDGIPVTSPQHWKFADGKSDIVDQNWEMFEAALRCVDIDKDDDVEDDQDTADLQDFIAAFDRMLAHDNVSVSKLTTGLFWMRPEEYLPIDNDLEKYLRVELQIELVQSVDGEGYLEFLGELGDLTSKTPYRLSLEAQQSDYWYPPRSKRNTGIGAEKWKQLLSDSTITTTNNLIALKCLAENPQGMTCAELGDRYGRGMHFYLSNIPTLGEKVAKKVGLVSIHQPSNSYEYWTVICLGRDVAKYRHGVYEWTLRPEVVEALNDMDLSSYPTYSDKQEAMKMDDSDTVRPANYWWLVASPKQWRISTLKVGEEQNYTVNNEAGHPRRIAKNFRDAKKGDLIVGYEASPTKKALALLEVSREPDEKLLYFKKVKDFEEPVAFEDISSNPDLSGMQFLQNMNGSLFALSKDEFDTIMEMANESESSPISQVEAEPYTDDDLLGDVFLSSSNLDELKELLHRKKNVILQGAPGTGKTFTAKRLAWDILGHKDNGHIEFVQFHQNTSYDEFVYGYRPTEDGQGFEKVPGVFVQFVRKAIAHPDQPYFFIIDEINRANISKVFGELLMTIEADHRGTDESVTLTVSQEPFYVPENLYIIGMMNTADRGLALIDYALRRRFAFFTMKPALDNERFKKQLAKRNDSRLSAVVEAVRSLNRDIAKDDALGEGFCIGHSYFCVNDNKMDDDDTTSNVAESIVKYELIPLIQEYWFDDTDKVEKECNTLLKCVE
ncbi:EVE domain-containing protein [Bifidobacterium sp. ESL0728]|uniref:AAA family ATPase n=1 Tax=Bifidobacterium sp. ESL0728 TaxID=2983220 RepID=UPI0023F8486E|nr:AAA family ATPase [Bifidobacterium sp. ESL0728]WEV58398.1 EVE domain-containing protein [Bifidobacterium sp. ESL0728]